MHSSRARRLVSGFAAAVVAIALNLSVSSTAQAAPSCSGSSHCYGLYGNGRFAGGNLPMNGAKADLEVDCLAVHSITTQWMNNEMWMSTNPSGDPNDWLVEGGFKAGAADGSHYGFQFWWDDHRNGTESDHFIRTATTADVGVYRTMQFSWVSGTNNWNVYLAGALVGTSTNNGDSVGHGIEAGVEEANTNTGQAWTHVRNVQYNNGSAWVAATGMGRIATVGSNLTLSALTNTSSGPNWSISTPSSRCGTTPAAAANSRAATPTTAVAAQTIALQAAQEFGARASETVQVVQTSRAKAAAFDDGALIQTPDAADPVYLVQFTGAFTGHGSPGSDSRTRGSVLRVSVDVQTGQVVDTTLTNPGRASLGSLGRVQAATATLAG